MRNMKIMMTMTWNAVFSRFWTNMSMRWKLERNPHLGSYMVTEVVGSPKMVVGSTWSTRIKLKDRIISIQTFSWTSQVRVQTIDQMQTSRISSTARQPLAPFWTRPSTGTTRTRSLRELSVRSKSGRMGALWLRTRTQEGSLTCGWTQCAVWVSTSGAYSWTWSMRRSRITNWSVSSLSASDRTFRCLSGQMGRTAHRGVSVRAST